MDFYCNTKEISKACQTVISAVATRAEIPALEGIKIDADENGVSLCGYDLEIGIRTKIDIQRLSSPGNVVIDAKTLCGIVKKLPDPCTEISTDEKGVASIKSGNAKFKLPTIPTEEFPEIPVPEDSAKEIYISQQTLKDMISQTLFAVSENGSKPIYTGALFDISENTLTMVGVDGYRIAICKERMNESTEDISFVVPGKTLSKISKMLNENSDLNVDISVSSRHVIFKIDRYVVFSRLLEGEFIDYKRACPKDFQTTLKVNTRELLQSVQRVSLLINDRLRSPVVCDFSSENGEINLVCNTEMGKASDSVNAKISGNDVHIGFNGKYLEEALTNSDCDEIKIGLNSALSPMTIMPDDGDSFLFLVLPVRLKNTGNSV